jgi:hypothetical protein
LSYSYSITLIFLIAIIVLSVGIISLGPILIIVDGMVPILILRRTC